jgi:hypothetical protein
VPPAPAPPSVTVVYQHKFDDNPSTHPYTTTPNQLNTKITNVNWTNSQSSWTNFAGFTGKAIATNSATPDTTRLYLNLTVNSGFMMDVKSYSFYHRSSTTGYTNYQLLVNGIFVGSGSIFVSSGTTLQSTGTINIANAIAGLTGSVTVTLKLFGGSNGNNATFRLDDFTLNGYTQEVQVYAESYRYGYQGSEKDDEVKGGGNSYTTFFRQLDSRVGRWFSIDPKFMKFPFESPYVSMGDNPIYFNDPQGDDKYKVDREGNISLKRKNNKDFDKIIGKNTNGIRISIKIDKGILNSVKTEQISRTSNILQDDGTMKEEKNIEKTDTFGGDLKNLEKTFEFMAQATKVEWGLFKFGENSGIKTGILTTSHDESSSLSNLSKSDYFKGSDFNGHDHIHPGGSKEPSGFYGSNKGDVKFAASLIKMFNDKNLRFRIYTKDGKYTPYDTKTILDGEGIIVKPKQ